MRCTLLCYNFEGGVFDSRCVIGNFHCHNSSNRTVGLVSTQLLTEIFTRNVSWGGGLLSPSCALKSGTLELLESSGPVQTCLGIPLSSINQWDSIGNFNSLYWLRNSLFYRLTSMFNAAPTGTYTKSDKYILNFPQYFFLQTNFNIILSFISTSWYWSLTLRFIEH